MGTLKTTNIQTITGSGTLTIGQSGESLSIVGKMSGQNYPAFEVYKTDTQSPSDNVLTKVTYNTVRYDTDSFWDATNNRFLPTIAGKYYVYSCLAVNSSGSNNVSSGGLYFYKNGSVYNRVTYGANTGTAMGGLNFFDAQIVEMNGTSDYVEIFGIVDVTTGSPQFLTFGANISNWFGAYRIGS